MTTVDQLREWGYRVEQSQEIAGSPIWYVDGFGMQTYVRDDDKEAMDTLADPDAHAEREKQAGETREQTELRWAEDPDNDYELPEERVEELKEIVAQQETPEGE
jgi:hypothetical protein